MEKIEESKKKMLINRFFFLKINIYICKLTMPNNDKNSKSIYLYDNKRLIIRESNGIMTFTINHYKNGEWR